MWSIMWISCQLDSSLKSWMVSDFVIYVLCRLSLYSLLLIMHLPIHKLYWCCRWNYVKNMFYMLLRWWILLSWHDLASSWQTTHTYHEGIDRVEQRFPHLNQHIYLHTYSQTFVTNMYWSLRMLTPDIPILCQW